jgi:parallel beta-helix repeat protein
MGIRSNKILSVISLVLVLTSTVSIIMAPTVKAEIVEPMATVFDVSPNPVAVGDIVVFTWDISPDPPSGYFYENIVLSLVMPDESKQILGPFMANSSGGVAVSFVPPWIGTYSATLSYPGQLLGEDYYLPFLAGPIYLDVVEYLPPVVESVHNLESGLNYTTIQAAIDAPETLSGHTILVDSGIYYENVVVTKSIILMGENRTNTIIDGGGGDSTVVNVTNVNNVEISGFTIQNGKNGIYTNGSSTSTFSENSILNSTLFGIYIHNSSDSTLFGNILTNNEVGIYLIASSNNSLSGNVMAGNSWNLAVFNVGLSGYIQDIDVSNTVNGKPVYYWINQHEMTVPSNAGYVGLVNCTEITVENLNLTNNMQGVLLAYTANSMITNNNFTNNGGGISLVYSSNITVSENTITDNGGSISLSSSPNSSLRNNVMSGNFRNLGVTGYDLSDFIQDIDVSNTVDGKPVYYWINQHNMAVPTDAGFVGLVNCTGITAENLNIANNGQGILVAYTANSTITNSNLTNNGQGVFLGYSSNITVSGNNISNNSYAGIYLNGSSSNTFSGNNITSTFIYGIHLYESSDNLFFHNNYINNNVQFYAGEWYVLVFGCNVSVNTINENYWSDYTGADSDDDGIGDTPYIINENNTDNHPLMAPVYRFDAGTWEQTQYFVDCVSNSTVSGFYFNSTEGAFLRFNVEGENGTSGFCRVTIPKDLLTAEDNWTVMVDGASVTPTVNEDASNTYLYFTYQHSIKTIEIIGTTVIPEFQSWALILFALTALAVAVAIYILNPQKTDSMIIHNSKPKQN